MKTTEHEPGPQERAGNRVLLYGAAAGIFLGLALREVLDHATPEPEEDE